jgi:hypothetical protein
MEQTLSTGTVTGTCDGCPAAADVCVLLTDGRRLELCADHARQHSSALGKQGAVIIVNLSPREQATLPGPAAPVTTPRGFWKRCRGRLRGRG